MRFRTIIKDHKKKMRQSREKNLKAKKKCLKIVEGHLRYYLRRKKELDKEYTAIQSELLKFKKRMRDVDYWIGERSTFIKNLKHDIKLLEKKK